MIKKLFSKKETELPIVENSSSSSSEREEETLDSPSHFFLSMNPKRKSFESNSSESESFSSVQSRTKRTEETKLTQLLVEGSANVSGKEEKTENIPILNIIGFFF